MSRSELGIIQPITAVTACSAPRIYFHHSFSFLPLWRRTQLQEAIPLNFEKFCAMTVTGITVAPPKLQTGLWLFQHFSSYKNCRYELPSNYLGNFGFESLCSI